MSANDPWYGVSDTVIVPELKKENAQLRAALAQAQATVTAQAAQLEQARIQLQAIKDHHIELNNAYGRPPKNSHTIAMCDAWLAANPAPARDETQEQCRCACGCKETADEKNAQGDPMCKGCIDDRLCVAINRSEDTLDQWRERM